MSLAGIVGGPFGSDAGACSSTTPMLSSCPTVNKPPFSLSSPPAWSCPGGAGGATGGDDPPTKHPIQGCSEPAGSNPS
jgi:hypothetical protein